MSLADRARADPIWGLLSEQGRPQAELALALQGDRLGVDPADQHHVAVHTLDVDVVEWVLRVINPLAPGVKELDGIRGHLPLLSAWPSTGSPSPASTDSCMPDILVVHPACSRGHPPGG
jgi:hypothetical protein